MSKMKKCDDMSIVILGMGILIMLLSIFAHFFNY